MKKQKIEWESIKKHIEILPEIQMDGHPKTLYENRN